MREIPFIEHPILKLINNTMMNILFKSEERGCFSKPERETISLTR